MIAAFLDHLRAERRLADHTIESYARDLTALARYAAGEERPLDALDRHALEAFVRQQMTSGLSPRSVARSIAAIRGFYRFLVLDRRLERNPADDLTPPRAWPALPKFLSVEEVDRLIAQPDVSTPLGLRDRAMIELLYATGMRVSELIAVRPDDLHLGEQYVTCIGKGSKERVIPVGAEAAHWIERYLRDGRPALVNRKPASTSKRPPSRHGGGRRSCAGLRSAPCSIAAKRKKPRMAATDRATERGASLFVICSRTNASSAPRSSASGATPSRAANAASAARSRP